MEMDEDYSSNIMETAPADFDDTRSIASSVSHKKPLYKRAWRKVYKTITAPEKDASGQRISLRDSLSMRLSRDTSVSSSSGSFFTGLRTPRSARHPTSRSEFALSETHTAPLPLSSGGGSPTRGSVRTPYTVENAIPLPIPTEEEKKDKPDSARDLHPSLAPADGGAGRAQVPPLHTVDMSLSQLVGRTDDTVTPVTSARVGSVDSTPMKAPASAPQFSAASLLHADGTRSSLHPNSAREEPLQGSMSKRQPDRHVESKEEPYSKRPHLSSDAPVHTSTSQLEKSTEDSVIAADSMSMGEQQESHQCSYNTSSPHNHNRRSDSSYPQSKPSQPAEPLSAQYQNLPAHLTDFTRVSCEPVASMTGLDIPSAAKHSMTTPDDSIPKSGTPKATSPSDVQALPDSKPAACKVTVSDAAADAVPQAHQASTAPSLYAIESEHSRASTQAFGSSAHPSDPSATPACPAVQAASKQPPSDHYHTSAPVVSQPSSQSPYAVAASDHMSKTGIAIAVSDSVNPGEQTELSQTANIPASPGSSLAIADSTLGATPSLPTTPMLYSETLHGPDAVNFDSSFVEESEASSGLFFVATNALTAVSPKPGPCYSSVRKSAKDALAEGRGQQRSLHTLQNHMLHANDHGCSPRTAAAAAELHSVSVELPDGDAKPLPSSVQDGLHADQVLLDGNVGTGKSPGHKDLAENVNAVDFVGKGTEGSSIDLKVDPADDGTADSDTCANPLATVLSAGAHSDVLENSVRELVSALEERLTTSGTLQGAMSGKNVTGDSRNGAVGVSNVQGVGTSESTGSTSGLGNSASARDMIEKYESEQPRARHIFSPSPKVKGSNDSAHGGNEDTMEGETNQPVQSNGGRKRGGPVWALAKVVMVATVGAGAAFAVARAR